MSFFNNRQLIISLLLAIGFVTVFSFRLLTIPPGLTQDEASIGYNALLISKTGTDENHKRLPLFVSTLDGSDWKQPSSIYTATIFFLLFGKTYLTFKLVNLVVAFLTGAILFELLKRELNFNSACLGFLVFMTTPIVLIHAHLSMENLFPALVTSAFLLLIYYFLDTGRTRWLFLAGVVQGIGLFAYYSMRLTAPATLIVSTVVLVWLEKKKRVKSLKAATYLVAGFLPFLVLLYLSKFFYPGVLLNSAKIVSLDSYQQFLYPFLSSFDFSFLFLKGDSYIVHSTGSQGMFLVGALPFFIQGVYLAFKQKRLIFILALLIFITAPIGFGLVDSVYRASRLLIMVPPVVLMIALSLSQISKQRLLLTICLALLTLNWIDFVKDYWFVYPRRIEYYFSRMTNEFIDQAKQTSQSQHKNLVISTYAAKKDSAVWKFFNLLEFNGKVESIDVTTPITTKLLVIGDASDKDSLAKQNFLPIHRCIDYCIFSYSQ